jgi:hypothetical protein
MTTMLPHRVELPRADGGARSPPRTKSPGLPETSLHPQSISTVAPAHSSSQGTMGVVSDAAPGIGHALGYQLAPRVLGSQFRTWSGRPAYPGSTLAAPGVRSGGGPGISIGGACGGGWGLPAAKNGGICIKRRSGPDSIACVTRCAGRIAHQQQHTRLVLRSAVYEHLHADIWRELRALSK